MEGAILLRKVRFASIFAAIAACNPLVCIAAIVGTYEGTIQEDGSRTELILRCASETRCELETKSSEGRDKPQTQRVERYSAEKTEAAEARRALKYAREHRALAAKAEYRGFAPQLMPLLESNDDVSGCLTLQLGSVVCELRSSPWREPAVLYFATDLANCSETRLFCVYVFLPLFKRSSVAQMTPEKPLAKATRPRAPTDSEISLTPPDKYRWVILYGNDPSSEQLAAARNEVRQGLELFRRRRFPEAYAMLLPEAERGEWIAQAAIGAMYADGLGRPRDLQHAMDWLRKAHEQGSLWAAETIARIYDDGILVPRDIEQAKKWYAKGGQNPRHTGMTRLADLVQAKSDAPFWTDPPTVSSYVEPRNWVAWAQRDAFVYDLYEKLDSAIRLPNDFPRNTRLQIHVGLAADGSVTSVQAQGWYTGSSQPKPEQLAAWSTAMLAAVRAASPLPKPPSWVQPQAKISVIYPPRFRQDGYLDRNGKHVRPE